MPPRTQQYLLWSLIEVPDDLGVYNVGGRLGAAGGPDAFWKLFSKINSSNDTLSKLANRVRVKISSSSIESNHLSAAEAVKSESQSITVMIGGGHDHGYSHLLGLQRGQDKSKWGCINIDAHLDVRKPAPLITSGSPFYLALENRLMSPDCFVEFGIQEHCNSSELWNYISKNKVRTLLLKDMAASQNSVKKFTVELQRLEKKCDHIAISLDLDALAQAFCPGVSAPQAEGFSPVEVFEMMRICGRSKKVRSLGVFELNPLYDVDQKTARVAAGAVWNFLSTKLSKSHP